jgi:hypothetical protein
MRHGCGYAVANVGHDTKALQAWLGHRNIQHTVRCTEVAPDSSRTSGGRLDVVPGRGRSAYQPVQNASGPPKDLRALRRHPEPGVSCRCGVKSRPADAQKFEDRVGGWLIVRGFARTLLFNKIGAAGAVARAGRGRSLLGCNQEP